MEKIRLKIKKLSPLFSDDMTPRYATQGAAAMDLCACVEKPVELAAGGRAIVPTGFSMQLPEPGLAAFIFARSGLAAKKGLALSNGVGVIDSDYTGEIKIAVTNFSDKPVIIEHKQRIAQMVVMPVRLCDAEFCGELEKTGRGDGGYGSTGV